MIDIKNFIPYTLDAVKELQEDEALDIRPMKRDRKVVIRKGQEGYDVFETGFYKEDYYGIPYTKLKKLLKTLEKKEFPRSNKLWFKIIQDEEINKEEV